MNEMEIEAIKTKCRRIVGLSNFIKDYDKFIELKIEVNKLKEWLDNIKED